MLTASLSQPADVIVRPPRSSDLAGIKLLAGSGIWLTTSPTDDTEQQFVQRFLRAIRSGDNIADFWVADANGTVVAAIGADAMHDDIAAVRWLRVSPEWRHPFLLLQMLRTALEYCKDNDFSHVMLEGQLLMLAGIAALWDSWHKADCLAGMSCPDGMSPSRPDDSKRGNIVEESHGLADLIDAMLIIPPGQDERRGRSSARSDSE